MNETPSPSFRDVLPWAQTRNDEKKKGRDRSRPLACITLNRETYFASARFGGVAGHDFTSVS